MMVGSVNGRRYVKTCTVPRINASHGQVKDNAAQATWMITEE